MSLEKANLVEGSFVCTRYYAARSAQTCFAVENTDPGDKPRGHARGSTCKPRSVQQIRQFTERVLLPALSRLGDHLSRPLVTEGLMRPTRNSRGTSRSPPQGGIVPAWFCSRWGLPGRRHCCRRRWSLTPPFHPYRTNSAVVFCGPIRGLPRPGVTRHRALWSADFPQTPCGVCDRPVGPRSTSILSCGSVAVNTKTCPLTKR